MRTSEQKVVIFWPMQLDIKNEIIREAAKWMAKSATHSRRVERERKRERKMWDCQDEMDRALRWAMAWQRARQGCHSAQS